MTSLSQVSNLPSGFAWGPVLVALAVGSDICEQQSVTVPGNLRPGGKTGATLAVMTRNEARSAALTSLLAVLLVGFGCRAGGSLVDDDSSADDDAGGGDDTGDDDSATSVPPRCDFLANGGAETGDTSGWTVTDGNFAAVALQDGSYPEPAAGTYQFFAEQEPYSRMVQTADLSKLAHQLGGGGMYAHLSSQVRNWNGSDAPSLELQALGPDGALLDSTQAGPFLSAYWQEQRVSLALPPATQTLSVAVRGTRNSGSDNDSYFDELELCVSDIAPPKIDDLRLGPWLGHPEPTAMTVLWETHSATIGRLVYGEDPEPSLVAQETTASQHHELRLMGLSPDSTVHFRLEGDGLLSKTWSFRTPPASAAAMSFVAWADNQNGPATFHALAAQMAVLQPDLAVSAGDIVQNGYEENYQGQFLGPLRDLAPSVPILVAAGNHEYYGDLDANLFDLHVAQPADEHCFSVVWGDTWFLFLDSELSVGPGSPQYQCIAAALDEPAFAAAGLRVALFHRPPRVEYWAGTCWTGEAAVRDYIEPMFEAAGVDLVINGHNHLYAYSPPAFPGGVTWVTTGGGGGGIDGEDDFCTTWDEIEFTSFEHHFLHVQVDGTSVSVDAIRTDGSVIHSFDL